jgi:hypothetical protein
MTDAATMPAIAAADNPPSPDGECAAMPRAALEVVVDLSAIVVVVVVLTEVVVVTCPPRGVGRGVVGLVGVTVVVVTPGALGLAGPEGGAPGVTVKYVKAWIVPWAGGLRC